MLKASAYAKLRRDGESRNGTARRPDIGIFNALRGKRIMFVC
jgi:hypothetical protein